MSEDNDSDADIYETPADLHKPIEHEPVEQEQPEEEKKEIEVPTYKYRLKGLDWWITDQQITESLSAIGHVKDLYFKQFHTNGQSSGDVDVEIQSELPVEEINDILSNLKFEDKNIKFESGSSKSKRNSTPNPPEQKDKPKGHAPLLYEDESSPIPSELFRFKPEDKVKSDSKSKKDDSRDKGRDDRGRDRDRSRRDRDRDDRDDRDDRRDRDRDDRDDGYRRDRDRDRDDRDRDDRDRRDRDRDRRDRRDRDRDDRDRRDRRDRDRDDRDRRDRDRDRRHDRDRDRDRKRGSSVSRYDYSSDDDRYYRRRD